MNKIPTEGRACPCRMADGDFQQFSEFIEKECGIRLPPGKKTMLEARLQKRLRALNITTFGEYCRHVFSPVGLETELHNLLDSVTTNTTHFFREPRHFEIMVQQLLPGWSASTGQRREFCVWSAGCSTGEEPYTLAMVLSDYRERNPGFRFSITATDISTRVLAHAMRAIYDEDKVSDLPEATRRKYFLRSKDRSRRQVRVAPEVRSGVSFRRLNFMEPFRLDAGPMDVIFCRNVLIYFERATQHAILTKLVSHLRPGGWLCIGHSESLAGLDLPLRVHAPTVYVKQGAAGG